MSKQEYESLRFKRMRAAIIQEKTFNIWALVRENRNSLDTHRVCNRITELLELAIADIDRYARQVESEKEKLRRKLEATKAELKTVKESVQWNCQECDSIRT